MSVLRSDMPWPQATGQTRPVARQVPKRRILAVVDGSARTADVIEFLIAQAGGRPQEVVILNVQPPPESWRMRGYESFKQDEIRDRLVNDRGKPVVAAVAAALDRAAIEHKERVEIGEMAETVERCAREEGCEQIVVAEPRSGVVRRWLARQAGVTIGSVVSQLLALADRPVVVVR
ncbi:MAG: universal stress protein [Xanthobacteraceae bacterium]|nr:universal stress protein [Xanthobacteraceae bacterium]